MGKLLDVQQTKHVSLMLGTSVGEGVALSDILVCELHRLGGLKRLGEDQVAALLATDLKDPGANLDEAVTVVKGNGAQVGGVGAEQESLVTQRARVGDGGVHEGLGWSEVGDGCACRVEDRRGAKARKEVDALELDVGGDDVDGGQLWGAEQHVADDRSGVVRKTNSGTRNGDRDAGIGIGEVVCVGVGCVVLERVGDDVGAGQHPGKGFEESSGAGERERGRVGKCGAAERDGLGGVWCRVWGAGFDGVDGHGFSRKDDGS